MAIEMKVDMLQLFSQWANFTGEKGPKNFWEFFLLPLQPFESPHQTATSHQRISPKPVGQKKNVSPSLKVTLVHWKYERQNTLKLYLLIEGCSHITSDESCLLMKVKIA